MMIKTFILAGFCFQTDTTPIQQVAAMFEINGCCFRSDKPINEAHAETINNAIEQLTKAIHEANKPSAPKQSSTT